MTDQADDPARRIVSQAFTVYYRWATKNSLSTDQGWAELLYLFHLLKEMDQDSASKVFDAALHGRDFPDDVEKIYPLPAHTGWEP